jgi:hypothetical protein
MILTSIKLSEEDRNFCKQNGFQFSNLLREAIFQKRQVLEGAVVDNVAEERRKRESIQKTLTDMTDFVNKKGLINEFMGII